MALDLGIFLEGSQSTFKVKVSENDAQAQFLLDKLTSSDGSVTITETNNGSIEQIDLTTSGGGGISSPLTTKGDLFTYSTADARLGVGADGQVLLADSAEATGLRWGAVSVDNMATADLTLTLARTHNLDGNILKFDTDETGYIEVGNVAVSEGIKLYQKSNGVNYINGSDGLIYIGAEGNDNLSIKIDGTSQFNDNLKIGSGSIGGTAARLKVRGNSLTTGECFIFEDSGGREILRGSNNRQLYSRTLNITGLGSTSATTALLVENSSGTDLFKIDDDGGFALGSGATYTNNTNVSIGTNAIATGASAISIGGSSSSAGGSSISIGLSASTTNSRAIAIGDSAAVSTTNGVAIGGNSDADDGVAVGHAAQALNTSSVAIGGSANANAFNGIAIGDSANVTAGRGTAIGPSASVTANRGVSLGYLSSVGGIYSTMISSANTAKANNVANSFAVNCNSTDHLFFVGNTADGFLNSTGNFVFGNTTVSGSAKLAVDSTTSGFLPPRMTTTEKNAIVAPASGLMVYDTTLNKLCVYTVAAWETITSV